MHFLFCQLVFFCSTPFCPFPPFRQDWWDQGYILWLASESSDVVMWLLVCEYVQKQMVSSIHVHSLLCFKTGIWSRDIRYKSNLPLTEINKILKNLESKKLIKAVKSVAVSILWLFLKPFQMFAACCVCLNRRLGAEKPRSASSFLTDYAPAFDYLPLVCRFEVQQIREAIMFIKSSRCY